MMITTTSTRIQEHKNTYKDNECLTVRQAWRGSVAVWRDQEVSHAAGECRAGVRSRHGRVNGSLSIQGAVSSLIPLDEVVTWQPTGPRLCLISATRTRISRSSGLGSIIRGSVDYDAPGKRARRASDPRLPITTSTQESISLESASVSQIAIFSSRVIWQDHIRLITSSDEQVSKCTHIR